MVEQGRGTECEGPCGAECNPGETGACCETDCQQGEPCNCQDGADVLERLAAVEADLAAIQEALEMYAKRRICAVMTDVDALERQILRRSPTTSEVKKAGLRAMGLDRG